MIAQLLIQFGPMAINLIEKLIAVWEKPALTVQEVNDLCAVARKSYDSYMQGPAPIGQPVSHPVLIATKPA